MTLISQLLQSLLFLTQWDPVNKVAHPHSGPFASACQSIPSHPPFPLRPRKAGHLEVTPWAVSNRYKGKPLPAKDATWYQRGLDLPVHHDGLLLPAAADLRAPPGSHHERHLALLLRLRAPARGAHPDRFLQVLLLGAISRHLRVGFPSQGGIHCSSKA